MFSQARDCGVDPDADNDRDHERPEYQFICSTCVGKEVFFQYRANYVCPWCGEGLMELQETEGSR